MSRNFLKNHYIPEFETLFLPSDFFSVKSYSEGFYNSTYAFHSFWSHATFDRLYKN